MNTQQLLRMQTGKGFIAALDQSGGSTPKTLGLYGVKETTYKNEEEMYALVHKMRTRVMESPAFTSEYILGAILFEDTMHRKVADKMTADYLWKTKGIVPFLKIDKGLAEEKDGAQMMKPMPDLDKLLDEAVAQGIFGTKMRSFIKEADENGIRDVVKQQFDVAKRIAAKGLIPIIEPEIDINSQSKEEAESILKEEIFKNLQALNPSVKVMLKISIPTLNDFYQDMMANEHVLRVVALSGGYSQEEANEKLSRNHGLIASFSRTLLYGLKADQTDEEFNETLAVSIKGIFRASTV